MFGHRSDGKKVKDLDPVFRVIPFIMLERNDSQVYFRQDVPIKELDEYIDRKMKEGIKLSYMMIVFAAIVRVLHERPQLNRFVVNGTIYQRNKITMSLAIKKSMSDEGKETVVKTDFNGTEGIYEVKEKISKNVEENKKIEASNNADKLVSFLNIIPNGLIMFIVKFLKFLDKHGILPKSIIELSPFHTSVFLTNVGSLGIDSIYHHIYNFGTTSLFFSMGKKKKSFVFEEDAIKEEKCISMSLVADERICDGHYYAKSFKLLQKYLKNPELLEQSIENIEK